MLTFIYSAQDPLRSVPLTQKTLIQNSLLQKTDIRHLKVPKNKSFFYISIHLITGVLQSVKQLAIAVRGNEDGFSHRLLSLGRFSLPIN